MPLGTPSGVRRLPTWAFRTLSIALYVAITCFLYGVRIFSNSLMMLSPGADRVQEVWFLAWPAHALTHGQSIFFTDWMNWPHGVNLMTNTSMPLLGLLAAPITWIFGAVTTYTVLMRLGYILSATAMQFVARRVGLSRPASIAAGLLYGFSTIQIVQGAGHLFLVFAPIPPLVLYCLFCLVVKRWSARRAGLTAGALLAADFLISAERVLMTLIAAALILAVAAAVNWRKVDRAAVWRVVQAGLWTGLVMIVVLAYPIHEMMGRAHVSGVAHPWIQSYASDLYDFFFPGPFTWLDPFSMKASILSFSSQWENGAYLGIPLIVALIIVAWRGWGNRLVRAGVMSTLVLLGMTMGEFARVDGVPHSSFKSPYELLAHLPYVENILPMRLIYMAWIGVALLAGYALDRLWTWRRTSESPHLGLGMRTALALGSVGLVVVTLLPDSSFAMKPTDVPSWMTSPAASKVIPAGSTVLFYPYPTVLSNHAMLDQAVAGFPYKIIGGEALVGNSRGVNVGIEPLAPTVVSSIFLRTYFNVSTGPIPRLPITPPLPPLPSNDSATIHSMFAFIHTNHVSAIVMEDTDSATLGRILPYLEASFGQPMVLDGGQLRVWDAQALRGPTA